jgi:protein-disulfide isomerase
MTSHPTGSRLAAGLTAAACSALLLTGCLSSTEDDPSAQDASSEGASSQEASAESSPAAQDSAEAPDTASAEDSQVPQDGAEVAGVDQVIEDGYALNSEGQDLPVVTMYTDYECPACGSFHPAVEQVAEELDGQVVVRVKNFPLSMHENAVPAAHAVEAAGRQGAAHEYANLVYDDVDEWSELSADELEDRFVELAGEAGLDEDRFRGDMGSSDVEEIVEQHRQQAEDLDLAGTPSFVADGRAIDLGEIGSAEDLRDVLRDAAEGSSGSADEAGTRA